MKFLVDAQLPRKLSRFLTSKNFDSIHTLDLPGKNFTTDSEIIEICEKQNRVIITKMLKIGDRVKFIFLNAVGGYKKLEQC
jgi:predicted nuclease of predicted toxin-antitoxin system